MSCSRVCHGMRVTRCVCVCVCVCVRAIFVQTSNGCDDAVFNSIFSENSYPLFV